MQTPSQKPLYVAYLDGASYEKDSKIIGAVLVWILSSLLVAWFEFDIFWNLPLLLFTMDLSLTDQALVVWSLLARTLLVTSPAILVIAASHRFGRFRTVRCAAWSWHLFVLTWLLVDCGLQCITGASLWYYVDKAMMTEDLAVGGDISVLTEGIQSALWITGGRIVLLFAGIWCVMRLWLSSRSRRYLPWGLTAVSMLSVLLTLGVAVAREFAFKRDCLEQVYGAMAFRTWLFHPDRISDYSNAAFGIPCHTEFADLSDDLRGLCRAPSRPQYSRLQPVAVDATCETAELPNVVILFTESLRHDVLNADRLPLLNRWAEQSLVAEQHFSGSNCSELGAFACFYSRIPMSYRETLDQQVPSEALLIWRQLGYQRKSISSCSPNFCRMNEFIGPLNLDHEMNFVQPGREWHENDQLVLSKIADELQKGSSPQFIFSHLMATHYSYYYPPEYDASPPKSVPPLPENPDAVDVLRDRYFKSLAFLDFEFDKFLTMVADTNTIVVITGDHGEAFLDNGFLCHGTKLSDIQTRTPLMILGPNVEPQRLKVPTSHLDIMPTLLHLAGAGDHAMNTSHGQSLLTVHDNKRGILLSHMPTGEWQCLLVHEDGRLGITLPQHSNEFLVTGFFDTRGRVDLTRQKTFDQIPDWKRRLQDVIGSDTKAD